MSLGNGTNAPRPGRSTQAGITLATYALLAAAATVSLSLPRTLIVRTASARTEPEAIRISGVARDFRGAHPDFDVASTGHFAGNAGPALISGRPALQAAAGFSVSAQWRDTSARPIPPHLAEPGYGGGTSVPVVSAPTFIDGGFADTFSSAVGPYGGGNVGPAPSFATGSPMPPVSPPTGMPPRVDAITYDGGTHTIAGDRYCKDFIVKNGAVVRASGAVRILSDEKFVAESGARIELLPGATLALWVRGTCTFQNNSLANVNTADPSRLVITNLGSDAVIIQNFAQVYALVYSPNGTLHLQDDGGFFGQVSAKSVHAQNSAGFHLDTARYGAKMCGVLLDDVPGAAGAAGTGAINSAATFDEWYADVLGTNLSGTVAITLTDNGFGVYEYLDDAFFPIDGRLFGNEGADHNYFFTFTFEATFVYDACAGQFLEFEGADDAWAYVNGALAMDLGGVTADTPQYVALDRLGLTDGETCTLRFLYAQRNPSEAVFRIRTNLPLVPQPADAVSAAFD
jgi:fibro-slime domain-containing protein